MVLKRRASGNNTNRTKSSKQSGGIKKKPRGRGNVSFDKGFTDISKRIQGANTTKNKSYLKLKSNMFQNKTNDARLPPLKNTLKTKNRSTTIQRVKSGSNLKLFTKHFDARSKIGSKDGKSIIKNAGIKEVAKKALEDIRNNTKSNIVNQRRKLNKTKVRFENDRPRVQDKISSSVSSLNRKSTFTGKSIQIITKNDLSMRERKDLVKGKSSLSGNMDSISKNRVKTIQLLTERPSYSNSVKESYESRYRPMSDSNLAHSKKSIPAKVVISNLHPNVTQEDIKELFGAIGELYSARLMSIGTAACVYANAEDAFAAYTKYHTRNLDGQPMVLKITSVDNETNDVPQSSFSRSSNRPQPQFKQATNLSSGRGLSNIQQAGGKPVVFTVKL